MDKTTVLIHIISATKTLLYFALHSTYGHVYPGCYEDHPHPNRILKIPGQWRYPKDVTAMICCEECQWKKYPFAGTQWGQECHCGDPDLRYLRREPESDCDKECKGDSKQNCGGYYRNWMMSTALPCRCQINAKAKKKCEAEKLAKRKTKKPKPQRTPAPTPPPTKKLTILTKKTTPESPQGDCRQEGCMYNGDCNSATGVCDCVGFTGSLCQNDVDECSKKPSPCHVKADCRNTKGSFVCTCNDGYSGDGITCMDLRVTSKPKLHPNKGNTTSTPDNTQTIVMAVFIPIVCLVVIGALVAYVLIRRAKSKATPSFQPLKTSPIQHYSALKPTRDRPPRGNPPSKQRDGHRDPKTRQARRGRRSRPRASNR